MSDFGIPVKPAAMETMMSFPAHSHIIINKHISVSGSIVVKMFLFIVTKALIQYKNGILPV